MWSGGAGNRSRTRRNKGTDALPDVVEVPSGDVSAEKGGAFPASGSRRSRSATIRTRPPSSSGRTKGSRRRPFAPEPVASDESCANAGGGAGMVLAISSLRTVKVRARIDRRFIVPPEAGPGLPLQIGVRFPTGNPGGHHRFLSVLMALRWGVPAHGSGKGRHGSWQRCRIRIVPA